MGRFYPCVCGVGICRQRGESIREDAHNSRSAWIGQRDCDELTVSFLAESDLSWICLHVDRLAAGVGKLLGRGVESAVDAVALSACH